MSSRLCPHCMRMSDSDTCPHCGKNVNYAGSPAHLPAGYVVSGRHPYVLGATLGQGGFGITYIALDMVTSQRVAIKEYFPSYCSGRTNHNTVTAYQNQDEVYLKGKERFLDEARTLKSLSDLKNIVNVLDFFEANNTAYLVMEFLDGSSLKEHAAKNGKFPAQKFLAQIKPLMEDIHRMHERGVIHRDIAPDNIILLPDGQMKLIDFGAARSYIGDKSMTVVVKKGFAPLEQYFSSGSSPSTDVYALAATIYYCITGTVPMDSAQRQSEGTSLASPTSLGADITNAQEKELFKALEIQQKTRTQSVQEFLDQLQEKPQPRPVPKTKPDPKPDPQPDPKPNPVKRLPLILAAVAAVLVLVGGFFLFSRKGPAVQPDPTTALQNPVVEAVVTEPPVTTQYAEPTAVTLKVWAPMSDQYNEDSWLNVMLPKFEEAHPEYTITWDIGVCGEGDAAGIVKNDPAAAADVFLYANDQMGTLIEAGALAKLDGSYLEQVKADVAQTYVDTVTYTDGGVYGFPMAPNTWFMWYNKDVFSEKDIKNLNTMLEKGVVSFPMNNSWYTASFFFGVGGTLFGPQGIDAAAGMDFSSGLCVEAGKFMIDFAKHPNFVNDIDGIGVAGMMNGTIHAMFSGPWDRPALEESLGDKLGCAVLPKFTLNGTDYQMKSFAGSKAIGVNPNASTPKAAMQLAAFLASADAQLARYELSAITPAATACAEAEAVKSNFVVATESAEMAAATIAQPTIAAMHAFWDPVRNFGQNILNGSITYSNVEAKLAATQNLVNRNGL